MEGDDVIRFAEALVQSIPQHGRRPLHDLLGGLANEDERPVPLALRGRQHLCCAEERRHVDVVSAGVHDPDLLAGGVLRLHRRRVRFAGLLDHRQRVHVRPDVDRRPVAVLQHRHDAICRHPRLVVLADVVGDRVAELAQPRRHERARLLLML